MSVPGNRFYLPVNNGGKQKFVRRSKLVRKEKLWSRSELKDEDEEDRELPREKNPEMYYFM